MSKPQVGHYCRNCNYPIPEYGTFCAHCGQKHQDSRITVTQLVREFFESVFNLDSRFFRTIGALLVPGKLTTEYFAGRHQHFVRPIRLFFVSAIVHFSILGFVTLEDIERGLERNAESWQSTGYRRVFLKEYDDQRDTVLALFNNNTTVNAAFDSLRKELVETGSDSTNLGFLTFANNSLETQSIQLAYADIIDMPTDTLLDHYELKGLPRLQVRQWLKINLHGASFSQFALGQLVWMVVLMMPALALILKLLYIRRRKYFVEHLVFSFHYHAFAFLLFSILFLGLYYLADENVGGLLGSGAVLFTMFYLYKAMRNVYGQGRFKTFLKFSLLNLSYLFIFIFFAVITFAISALTF